MDGTALPPGDALLPAAPGPSPLQGAVIGLASGGEVADSVSSMSLAADAVQRAARAPLPPGAIDAYAPGAAAFMMSAAMPQRRVAPVAGMDFTQMPKVPDVVSSTPLGMLAFPSVAKTPPKLVAPRQTPDNAVTADALAGRVEEAQGRMPHTPPSACDGMVTSPGGLAGRRGCGSGGSSTVSSSASGPAGRCGAVARGSISTLASRSNANRKVSTPIARPAASTPGGTLATNSFHTEYREQMSPSWWLGAAACSSSWLQLAPPPEVLELVEKKKLTEQFKTIEGLIDRADYLGALRLQADRRNVLHFLSLDEQEMQTYLWQPRFPRIIDLTDGAEGVPTGPPPGPADYLIDPKQLWLRLLSIAPPLYSTAAPIAASSRKKQATSESLRREAAASPISSSSPEPQEYCLNNSGEQFLPLLFQDCCGADECVPPDELLQFEEDALREIAHHIEAKLTHALTCMLLSAKTRARLAARKRSHSLPASLPEEEEDKGAAVLDTFTGSDYLRNEKKKRARGNDADIPLAEASQQKCNVAPEPSSSSGDAQLTSLFPSISEVGDEEWGPSALSETPAPSNSGCAVCISLEDLVATYGPAPRLMRHEHCFQQDSDFRQITM
ncbi:hypothetical protein Esti_003559 [Eimeria stiedai]